MKLILLREFGLHGHLYALLSFWILFICGMLSRKSIHTSITQCSFGQLSLPLFLFQGSKEPGATQFTSLSEDNLSIWWPLKSWGFCRNTAYPSNSVRDLPDYDTLHCLLFSVMIAVEISIVYLLVLTRNIKNMFFSLLSKERKKRETN